MPKRNYGFSRRIAVGAVVGLALGLSQTVAAQGGGTIRLISPYAPGSAPELAARLLADEMSPRLGAQVIVENRPGGTGKVATEYLVRSDPDGRTLLFAGTPQLLLIPALDTRPSYDMFKDARIVSLTTKYDMVLIASASSGIKSAKELFARIRQKPNNVSYYTSGSASPGALAGKILAEVLKGEAVEVGYKGTTLAIPDVLAGRVTFGLDTVGGRIDLVKAGKLVFLATSGRERIPSLPNVPTIFEEGLPEFYKVDWTQWNAVIAPSKTSDEVVNRLYRVIVESMASPSAQPRLAALFLENAAGPSPQEATRTWLSNYEKLRPALIAAGAKLD